MTLDESRQVEELLREWHRWQDAYRPALAGGRCDSTCREYRIGNQWLDAQERAQIADAKIWKRNSEQVEVCVDSLSWLHRAAIQASMKGVELDEQVLRQIEAAVERRNAEAGVVVWRNPHTVRSHAMYQEAKELLLPKFLARGLVKVVAPVE